MGSKSGRWQKCGLVWYFGRKYVIWYGMGKGKSRNSLNLQGKPARMVETAGHRVGGFALLQDTVSSLLSAYLLV